MSDLTVGGITGGHSFDVSGCHRLFRSFDGMDCYLQSLEEWAADFQKYGRRYDALVFYNMHKEVPEAFGRYVRPAIDSLAEGPGHVILHHGILAFKQDPTWDAMVGMTDRTIDGFSHDETLGVHVEETRHPITQGLSDWGMVDETYDFGDVGPEDNDILLTVDHPESMSTMAWTRQYEDARVFNDVFGHDDQPWSDEHFRTVLARGIRWTAGSN